MINLKVGDKNESGTIEIIAEDSLCYQVNSEQRGARGIRTISKKILIEFIEYLNLHPDHSAQQARENLCGKTDVDKFEYGYYSTIYAMVLLNKENNDRKYSNFKHILEYFCAHVNYIVTSDITTKGYDQYLKPYIDSGTFRKAGHGYKPGQRIQEQISAWEKYELGKISINVYGNSYKGRSTYLDWCGTSHNIAANWKKDSVISLQLIEFLGHHKWDEKSTIFTIEELGLYDADEPNSKIKEFFDAFEQMLKDGPVMPETSDIDEYDKYLTALRTKPFLLLAGISGTGKSRLVRELAYKSCPNIGDLRADPTTPGNYLMVEVKPNWHDSSELLGYYSNINKKYVLTSFVRFLVKAKKYPNVPFFVCLDEMNLAPVEQYFAEFLSVLETRRNVEGNIKSGVIIEKKYLTELEEDQDLSLPSNVFIVGTVNMDDTTHQFSRKVIDRAMTIEMNGGNLEDMFDHSSALDYTKSDDEVWTMDNELSVNYVSADEVVDSHPQWEEQIKSILPQKLDEINKCLNNTPFGVSYRVLNELVIYLGVLLDDEPKVDEQKFDELVNKAVDRILLMKILPRIEGDAEMFNLNKDELDNDKEIKNKLELLKSVCPDVNYADGSMTSKQKLDEMIGRLNSGFTRFWP